ncbi:MAG TPA: hypothetical protein VE991_06420 [Acidimicrobiales bacterium]|nr:hypothetical protein [Acidimicrobiales bacterium]
MPKPKPDPDERFSLHPEEGEDVLRKLLGAEEDEGKSEDDEQEEPP